MLILVLLLLRPRLRFLFLRLRLLRFLLLLLSSITAAASATATPAAAAAAAAAAPISSKTTGIIAGMTAASTRIQVIRTTLAIIVTDLTEASHHIGQNTGNSDCYSENCDRCSKSFTKQRLERERYQW